MRSQLVGLCLMAVAVFGLLCRLERKQRRDVTPQWQPHMAAEGTVRRLADEDRDRIARFCTYEAAWEKKWEAQGLIPFTTKRGIVRWTPRTKLSVVQGAGGGPQP